MPSPRLGAGDKAVIRQIVSRFHVGQRYSDVLRYLVSRTKPKSWKATRRSIRRAIVREMCKVHRENRRIYAQVMSGRF